MRRRGRNRAAGSERSRLPEQRPFAQPRMRYAPTEVVSADELEAIHGASLRILRRDRHGLPRRRGPPPAGRGRGRRSTPDGDAGAVRPGDGRRDRSRTCPSSVPRCTRGTPSRPSRSAATTWPSAPSAARRTTSTSTAYAGPAPATTSATCSSCARASTSCTSSAATRSSRSTCTPRCATSSAAHDVLTLTDKALHSYSLGRQRNRDVLEMVRIARGVDDATLEREPSVFTVVNSSSPLRLDTPDARRGSSSSRRATRSVVMTPFTLSGAMAPVTLAGAVAQQNAEALAGMVFTQVVRPGAPVVYGGLHVERRHAVRRAGVRHAGVRAHGHARRPAGPALRRALPLVERVRRQRARRPGRLRERVLAVGGRDGRRQLPDARRRLDGGRPPRLGGQARPRRRPAGDGRRAARSDRRRRRHAGLRRHPRGRSRRALLRRRPHPGALPDRVLPPDDLGLAQLRDMGRSRPARGRRAGRRAGPGASSTPTSRRRWTKPLGEELDDFVARRVAEGGVATDY